MRRFPNSIFNICRPVGFNYLTRLRVVLSHCVDKHFVLFLSDLLNPIFNCDKGTETEKPFVSHQQNFT